MKFSFAEGFEDNFVYSLLYAPQCVRESCCRVAAWLLCAKINAFSYLLMNYNSQSMRY